MISNKATARKVERTMRKCSAALNESIRLVMDTCPEAEFRTYRKTIGEIMGAIYLDVVQPIHRRFPDLEPKEPKSRNPS
jgi:hypothetical protein